MDEPIELVEALAPGLLELPDEERRHPLFRKGYNLGSAHAAQARQAVRPAEPTEPAEPSPAPACFDVTTGGLLDKLVPGVRVERDLASHSPEQVVTETPCCGRRITLPRRHDDPSGGSAHDSGTTHRDGGEEHVPAACCLCRIGYTVHLVQEEPDGFSDDDPPYIAVFVVEHTELAIARHRTGSWERHDGSLRRGRQRPSGQPARQPAGSRQAESQRAVTPWPR